MVSLTIDGQRVSVPAGTTILEAAKSVGIDIPTFCYDKELTLAASCRICVVEAEGFRNLPAACATPVSEGMVVHTESEKSN
ncbi:MAG: 2Fe-2S iron-sulfur cluster-binding protein [Thermincola sp.]|nr:2Fe-2S iron-sulfur cluster-binding protein [Thermincola sp.]MDT3702477.1 2Fe-2S iron-sulfur cluster-binding protein [Thermincola sp.]